jgi:hypothetical protein
MKSGGQVTGDSRQTSRTIIRSNARLCPADQTDQIWALAAIQRSISIPPFA